jgi:hypothetical protein
MDTYLGYNSLIGQLLIQREADDFLSDEVAKRKEGKHCLDHWIGF